MLGRAVGDEALCFYPGSVLGFGLFGEFGVESAGETEDRETLACERRPRDEWAMVRLRRQPPSALRIPFGLPNPPCRFP